ncbi:MAG: hypothetical protein ACFCUN_08745 [Hyphomicrobiaceae bacterium]
MKRLVLSLMVAAATTAAIAVAIPPADARPAYDFDRRIIFLEGKIERGRQIGSITYIEGLQLRRLVRNAKSMLQDARADGRITPHESRALTRELDRVNARIEAEAQDRRRRPGILPRVGR